MLSHSAHADNAPRPWVRDPVDGIRIPDLTKPPAVSAADVQPLDWRKVFCLTSSIQENADLRRDFELMLSPGIAHQLLRDDFFMSTLVERIVRELRRNRR